MFHDFLVKYTFLFHVLWASFIEPLLMPYAIIGSHVFLRVCAGKVGEKEMIIGGSSNFIFKTFVLEITNTLEITALFLTSEQFLSVAEFSIAAFNLACLYHHA
ncbi:hypothetical protein ACJX0J_030674, partial [Zea mays]